jgi:Putative zinc-finger
MSRFPRLRRRPDHWADAHARARARAAERLDGPLGLAESTWLDAHLAECAACAAVAASYAADRLALRALRDDQPEPPRDLWARTAAAIEILSDEAGVPAELEAPEPRTRGRNSLPLGAMSAFAVVVLVIGATLLSNGIGVFGPQTAVPDSGVPAPSVAHASLSPEGPGAEATPLSVGADDVAFLDAGKGYARLRTVKVDEVCPAGTTGCPALREQNEAEVAFENAPRTIIGSPTTKQAVAIAKGPDAGDEVIVVQLPQADSGPSATPKPEASTEPSTTPSGAAPIQPTDTASPSPSVTGATSPSLAPLESAAPTQAARRLAIASGIEVVGESAAFSSDGTWFAFTARPAAGDGGGSDVFVWRVGDQRAERLTTDGHSYFASWSGDRIVVSRPGDATSTTSEPVSALVDPASGDQRSVGSAWRPMVDPSGRLAIVWDGTIERTGDPEIWAPAHGRLELRSWSRDGGAAPSKGSGDHIVVTDAALGDFDVRWDDTGEWVAVWVGDQRDAPTGRLTLYHVDVDRERLEKVDGAPVDVQALPGFSIGSGRLAWATPRGQGGEGSRVQIAAWSGDGGDGVGTAESKPGEDVRIIR